MKKLKKYSPRYLYTYWLVRKDREFLVMEGLREAFERKIRIDLSQGDKEDTVDVRPLIALVADKFPDVARRYLDNLKKLGI